MENRKKMTVVLSLTLIVLFAFTAQVQAETYKLGLSLAITGPTSDAGDPYSKGVEDYFNFVNDMKILGDDKIDCTIRDDQYKTDVTNGILKISWTRVLFFTSTTPPAAHWP